MNDINLLGYHVGIGNCIMLGLTAGFALLCGCEYAPGGDSPVTTQRLTGSRLIDIREELSWTFDESVVVIENNGLPIPSDLIRELLGSQSAPKHIQAGWRFDEKAGMLLLTNVKADDEDITGESSISIKPAGHVRVNLGTRQYNLIREGTNNP